MSLIGTMPSGIQKLIEIESREIKTVNFSPKSTVWDIGTSFYESGQFSHLDNMNRLKTSKKPKCLKVKVLCLHKQENKSLERYREGLQGGKGKAYMSRVHRIEPLAPNKCRTPNQGHQKIAFSMATHDTINYLWLELKIKIKNIPCLTLPFIVHYLALPL